MIINLNLALKYFLDLADLINEQFQLNHKEPIDQLRQQYFQLDKQNIKPEDATLTSSKENIPIRDCTVVFKLTE